MGLLHAKPDAGNRPSAGRPHDASGIMRRFGDHAAAVRITSTPAQTGAKKPPQKFCGGFVQNGNAPSIS